MSYFMGFPCKKRLKFQLVDSTLKIFLTVIAGEKGGTKLFHYRQTVHGAPWYTRDFILLGIKNRTSNVI